MRTPYSLSGTFVSMATVGSGGARRVAATPPSRSTSWRRGVLLERCHNDLELRTGVGLRSGRVAFGQDRVPIEYDPSKSHGVNFLPRNAGAHRRSEVIA